MSSNARVRCLVLAMACLVFPLTGGRRASAGTEADEQEILQGYRWQLVRADSAKGEPLTVFLPRGMRPTRLYFIGDELSAEGCNTFAEGYALVDRRIVQSKTHLVTRTLIGCGSPRGEADDAIAAVLNGNPRYRLINSGKDKPQLELTSDADAKLVLEGIPTLRTRFGSDGERIFFDIAPGTIRCAPPGQAKRDCLQVRQVFEPIAGTHCFGLGSAKAPRAGPWQLLYEGIEGFTESDCGLYLGVQRFRRRAEHGTANVYILSY